MGMDSREQSTYCKGRVEAIIGWGGRAHNETISPSNSSTENEKLRGVGIEEESERSGGFYTK